MTATEIDPLQRADEAAMQQGASGVGDVAQACPLPVRHAIEVCVVGEDDVPLADVAVELQRADGMMLRGRSGADGVTRFDGLEEGSYQAALYELDRDAWALLSSAALPPERARGSGEAAWSAPAAGTDRAALEHTIQAGECLAQLGALYGFAPETLWELPENGALRAGRDSMYVLYAGGADGQADRVVIPALRAKSTAVVDGKGYLVRRKAVPELFDVRMLRNGKPRAHVDYLFAVSVAEGVAPLERKGKTDADGRLREAIPPDALTATVTLLLSGGPRRYDYGLGRLDPISTLSGVRQRLENLGYPCGGEKGEAGPATRAAIEGFQRDHQLDGSRGLDQATRDKLQQVYA